MACLVPGMTGLRGDLSTQEGRNNALSTSRTAPRCPTAAWRPPAQLLSKLTGEDVIAVDTTTTQARAEGLAVIRLVALRTYPLPTGRDDNPDDPPHPFG